MDEDPELAKRWQEMYAAKNLFDTQPCPETRAAYKKASAALNLALHHAGKKDVAAQGLSAVEPIEQATNIPPEDAKVIEAARLAQNAAYNAMYADPGPTTHESWKQARNHYQSVRRRLDPIFRAKRSEATRKSQAKAKK